MSRGRLPRAMLPTVVKAITRTNLRSPRSSKKTRRMRACFRPITYAVSQTTSTIDSNTIRHHFLYSRNSRVNMLAQSLLPCTTSSHPFFTSTTSGASNSLSSRAIRVQSHIPQHLHSARRRHQVELGLSSSSSKHRRARSCSRLRASKGIRPTV